MESSTNNSNMTSIKADPGATSSAAMYSGMKRGRESADSSPLPSAMLVSPEPSMKTAPAIQQHGMPEETPEKADAVVNTSSSADYPAGDATGSVVPVIVACSALDIHPAGSAAPNILEGFRMRMSPRKLAQLVKIKTKLPVCTRTLKPAESGNKAKIVHKLLAQAGVDPWTATSCCLKAGIANGFVVFEGKPEDLKREVLTGKCLRCGEELTARVEQLLAQPDYAGADAEGKKAPIKCAKCEQGHYITGICTGKLRLDTGNQHNHCTECKTGGKCLGDYRNLHCEKCGCHFFAQSFDSPCTKCESKAKRQRLSYVPKASKGSGKVLDSGQILRMMQLANFVRMLEEDVRRYKERAGVFDFDDDDYFTSDDEDDDECGCGGFGSW